MYGLQDTLSNHLTLQEVLTRLEHAEAVDGLALFGSQITTPANPASDYDLLILVLDPPVRIFQMLTHIDGRMAAVAPTPTSGRLIKWSCPNAPIILWARKPVRRLTKNVGILRFVSVSLVLFVKRCRSPSRSAIMSLLPVGLSFNTISVLHRFGLKASA